MTCKVHALQPGVDQALDRQKGAAGAGDGILWLPPPELTLSVHSPGN